MSETAIMDICCQADNIQDTMRTPPGAHFALPALALAGALQMTPGLSITQSASEIEISYADFQAASAATFSVTDDDLDANAAIDDDLAARDIPTSELAAWGRSMMGGDTSEMLDI